MAFHDWNGDGKKDMADDFIEYQIYKDVTKDSDNSSNNSSNHSSYSNSSSDNSGCYFSFWLLIFFFIISCLSKCS